MAKIKVIIFDWGDTLMMDFSSIDPKRFQGAMAHWPKVAIISGVEEVLRELSNKYICCVASNAGDSTAELMGQALARVGIKDYFIHLITSRELGYNKPDLNFFHNMLKELQVQPEETVMVGNDYAKDIIPAKTVGIRTVFFNKNETDQSDFSSADMVIPSMNGLPAAIAKLC